jgi:D-alanyl-D-alanine carboxypeptidase-like protein/putative Flp pilus-assembly TadE/G-like protein
MVSRGPRSIHARRESGQAALLMLGVLAAVLAGVLVLFGFGQALGARGHAQRAADLAAISAAQVMRHNFTRLFEPAFLEGGVPNPRHLSNEAYLSLARAAALRGAVRNGLQRRRVAVSFPAVPSTATRVTVAVRDTADVRLPDDRRRPVEVRARATAEIAADAGGLGMPTEARGGGYDGPLAYRQGKPMRPDVALAFDRVAAAARAEAGLTLLVTSGYRSDAEQARLFAAHPDPKWVAPPGTSLHRYATELDLGPPVAYGWLDANCHRLRLRAQIPMGALALRVTVRYVSTEGALQEGSGERFSPLLPGWVIAALHRRPFEALQWPDGWLFVREGYGGDPRVIEVGDVLDLGLELRLVFGVHVPSADRT